MRPLARRRLTMAWPARVDIRARKPCLRLRRRTFGWYVRFMDLLGRAETRVRHGSRASIEQPFGRPVHQLVTTDQSTTRTRLAVPHQGGYPQVWRPLWRVGKTCKSPGFGSQRSPPEIAFGRTATGAMIAHSVSSGGSRGVEYGVQLNAADVWTEIADRLGSAISDQTYHTWFGEVRTRSVDGGVVVLETPNGFSRSWIEGHYLELLGGRRARSSRRRRPGYG